jgi:hypothetical protein
MCRKDSFFSIFRTFKIDRLTAAQNLYNMKHGVVVSYSLLVLLRRTGLKKD